MKCKNFLCVNYYFQNVDSCTVPHKIGGTYCSLDIKHCFIRKAFSNFIKNLRGIKENYVLGDFILDLLTIEKKKLKPMKKINKVVLDAIDKKETKALEKEKEEQ